MGTPFWTRRKATVTLTVRTRNICVHICIYVCTCVYPACMHISLFVLKRTLWKCFVWVYLCTLRTCTCGLVCSTCMDVCMKKLESSFCSHTGADASVHLACIPAYPGGGPSFSISIAKGCHAHMLYIYMYITIYDISTYACIKLCMYIYIYIPTHIYIRNICILTSEQAMACLIFSTWTVMGTSFWIALSY